MAQMNPRRRWLGMDRTLLAASLGGYLLLAVGAGAAQPEDNTTPAAECRTPMDEARLVKVTEALKAEPDKSAKAGLLIRERQFLESLPPCPKADSQSPAPAPRTAPGTAPRTAPKPTPETPKPLPPPPTEGEESGVTSPKTADDLAAAVLAEIDFARTKPGQFAQILRQGPRTPATDEAIGFLEHQAPLPPLTENPALGRVAAALAADEGPRGLVGHTGSDGSSTSDRMHRAKVWASIMAEDISVGQTTAAGLVSQLVIDEGVPTRAHRADIFHPLLKSAGVACGPHALYREMCVIDLTSAIVAR